jgi:hypothetical protein
MSSASNPLAQNPAMVQLIEALAERLVLDHLTLNSASEHQEQLQRTKHVNVAAPAKAA